MREKNGTLAVHDFQTLIEEKLLEVKEPDGRQWRKWRIGQEIPAVENLCQIAEIAVVLEWIDRRLATAITTSFALQQSNEPVGPRSSWDQDIAMKLCFELAEESGCEELQTICKQWARWIYGPDPNRKNEFEEWFSAKWPGWEIQGAEDEDETVYLLVEQAMLRIIELGVSDPEAAFKRATKRLFKDFAKIVDAFNESNK